MFQGHLCWISGVSLCFFLCPIWSCVNLNRKSSWDVLQICWAMAGPQKLQYISGHPEIPQNDMVNNLPRNKMGSTWNPPRTQNHRCQRSWEQALGHSKRPSMNVGHPLAGWPARRNKDPPLFEKEHHHIQQKTRWSDSIVIAHLWRGHFVHWCILQTKSWVNMSELNIYNYNISANWEFPLKHYWKKKLCSGTSRCIWRVSLVQMLFSFTSNHWKPRKKYQGLMFFSAGWMEK